MYKAIIIKIQITFPPPQQTEYNQIWYTKALKFICIQSNTSEAQIFVFYKQSGSSAVVEINAFPTADCLDNRVSSSQTGRRINAIAAEAEADRRTLAEYERLADCDDWFTFNLVQLSAVVEYGVFGLCFSKYYCVWELQGGCIWYRQQ